MVLGCSYDFLICQKTYGRKFMKCIYIQTVIYSWLEVCCEVFSTLLSFSDSVSATLVSVSSPSLSLSLLLLSFYPPPPPPPLSSGHHQEQSFSSTELRYVTCPVVFISDTVNRSLISMINEDTSLIIVSLPKKNSCMH